VILLQLIFDNKLCVLAEKNKSSLSSLESKVHKKQNDNQKALYNTAESQSSKSTGLIGWLDKFLHTLLAQRMRE
jgi:hypothetical protein